MQQYRVGIIGATGMVGQRFVLLLKEHPWFQVTCLAASWPQRRQDLPGGHTKTARAFDTPIPEAIIAAMPVMDADRVEEIAPLVDFASLLRRGYEKDEILALEERYAKAEVPVISNNSANRMTPDVPMLIPEVNGDHAQVIPMQRRRLGTRRGFIAVKPIAASRAMCPPCGP